MDEKTSPDNKIQFEIFESNSSSLDENKKDQINSEKESNVQLKYPKTVFLIILSEFCERFSYYGIRTVLFLYLTNFIKVEQHAATALYHAFTVICYFTPVFGAILADGYLGLYKTILCVSILYCIGEIILTVTSVIPFGAPNLAGPAIALLIIAIGTGGIKPCVSAFGGNQFHPSQKKYLSTFFSVFYLSINVGSTIGTILTPIFRSDVKCFGDDCYPLAFGVPSVVMIIAIVVYALGTKYYNRDDEKNKKGNNIIIQTGDCMFTAIKNKIKLHKSVKKSHWLDYADSKYGSDMISDVKAFYKILIVFLPLPIFWALYDQQGSRWTAQAQQLDGRLGSWTIKPDQFQAINPIFIVALVPLFDLVIYPLFSKFNILKKELHRMSIGLIFAILSFAIAAILESKMQNASILLNPSNRIRIINISPCDIKFYQNETSKNFFQISKMDYLQNKPYDFPIDFLSQQKNEFLLESNCMSKNQSFVISNWISLNNSNSPKNVILHLENGTIKISENYFNQTNQLIGFSEVRFLRFKAWNYGALDAKVFNKIVKYDTSKFDGLNKTDNFEHSQSRNIRYSSIDYSDYDFKIKNSTSELLEGKATFETCGRYTILLFPNHNEEKFDYLILTDIYPNGLHLCWQLIQIFVMTVGEVMFSISGITFAYSQAPASMKSVMQGLWCLTVAFGNLVVVLIAEAKFVENQVYEYVIFIGLLIVATVIFIILSWFYKYTDKTEVTSIESIDSEQSLEQNKPLSHSTHPKYSTDSEVKLVSLNTLDPN
ncbi:unnamed protein product [Brachionus calyciflorus]|uniref:Uncharacterized protein n=1 Tax=Brachionus calyciflorus TaxID=104777 RepID=A0A814A974_9BILA|nr:unnamed protein product [Brachionus calyciflorus]